MKSEWDEAIEACAQQLLKKSQDYGRKAEDPMTDGGLAGYYKARAWDMMVAGVNLRGLKRGINQPEAALPSVIEQHGLCVSFDPKAKLWNAQDCRYNALVRGATLDEAVQKLMPKLMRCQRCQITTTREVHVFYCKAEDCEVRQPLPQLQPEGGKDA